MTLPSSGPLGMLQIYAEFGVPAGTPFTQLVRGGPYVPNTPANAGVPSAPPIGMLSFYGASAGGGGGGALTVNKSGDAAGEVNVVGTGPSTAPVSAAMNVLCSGGTGSYSCTWTHVSGDASISTPGSNVFNPTFVATVNRNSCKNAVKRCNVSDGVSTGFVDVNVSLCYFDET